MAKQTGRIYGPAPEPYKVKLMRESDGGYGWEIAIIGNDITAILNHIRAADKTLRETCSSGEA